MKLLTKSAAVLLMFITSTSLVNGQTSRCAAFVFRPDFLMLSCPGLSLKTIDNEYVDRGEAIGNFYCNPLRLSGSVFDYNTFTLESKGELTLVKGDLKTGKMVEIPFSVYLRREGKLVAGSCVDGVVYTKIEIAAILGYAEKGDELVVEPFNKEDWPAKRIVRIEWQGC